MPLTDVLGSSDAIIGNSLILGKDTFYAGYVVSQHPNNTLVLTQQATWTQQYNRSASNTLTLTQSCAHPVDKSVTSTLSLTQAVSVIRFKMAIASNTLAVTHTCTTALTYHRSVISTLVMSHAATRTISKALALSQSLTLTQTAVGISSKSAKNVLTLTQSATYTYAKGTHNTLSMNSICSVSLTVNRHLHSNFIPFQTLTYNATFRRSIEHTLTLIQTVVVARVKPAKNTLFLTQQALADVVKPTKNTLSLTQNCVVHYTSNQAATNQLFLTQSVQYQRSVGTHAQSILAFNQFARATRVLHVTASNTLVLHQDLVRTRTLESVLHTLTLTQTVNEQHLVPRSVLNHLNLSQSCHVSITYNRSVSHTLVFKNSFDKFIGIGGGQIITVPTVQVVKVQRLTILQSASNVIVLGAPEFNDKEIPAARINIKRAMDGTRRIYKRDAPTSRLAYDFVMDRKKAIELRAFIIANNSEMLTLTNWKGEIWKVLLINNPFSFVEDSYWQGLWGNKSSIQLEFEGVKIN